MLDHRRIRLARSVCLALAALGYALAGCGSEGPELNASGEAVHVCAETEIEVTYDYEDAKAAASDVGYESADAYIELTRCAEVAKEEAVESMGLALRTLCDNAVDEFVETLELESRDELISLMRLIDDGPKTWNPQVEIRSDSITIDDAHACSNESGNVALKYLTTDLGFNSSLVGRSAAGSIGWAHPARW